MIIRPYRDEDFETISSWWDQVREVGPLPGMMVPDGTFVVEIDDEPVMTLTVFKTQSKEVSFLEGFCRKPDLDRLTSKQVGALLWEHCFQYLRDDGFKRVICLSHKPALTGRYQNFGMQVNLNGLSALGKVL